MNQKSDLTNQVKLKQVDAAEVLKGERSYADARRRHPGQRTRTFNSLCHAAGARIPGVAAGGVDAAEAGENLGGGYMSLAKAMAGWRGSPEHDANLLMPEASRFGIALAKNPKTQYGVYWAMEIAAEPPEPAPSGGGTFLSLSGAATQMRWTGGPRD